MSRYITVDCPRCKVRVRAYVLADDITLIGDGQPPEYRISFAKCPDCADPVLAHEDFAGDGQFGAEWTRARRLWPSPQRETSKAIPEIVSVSLEEALRCHRAGAYTACAVMCGRALEGICVHFGTATSLARGLKELLQKGIIDEKLYQWSESLRAHRNLGAHASEEKVTKDDATDLTDFLNAICDYVFVLTAKFESFMRRKTEAAQRPAHASGSANASESADA